MARNVKSGNKKFTGFYLPVEVLTQFQRLYPQLATTFIRRCLIRANCDKQFFDDVFFTTRDEWSKLGSNNPDYTELK